MSALSGPVVMTDYLKGLLASLDDCANLGEVRLKKGQSMPLR